MADTETENGRSVSSGDLQDISQPHAEKAGSKLVETTSSEGVSRQLQPTKGSMTAAEPVTSEDTLASTLVQAAPDASNGDAVVTTSQLMTQTDGSVRDVNRSGTGRAKPKRTKRRVTGSRTCRVCGDHAIAHNFGALTCETCKAFFRRNAGKTQIPPCLFNKRCVITRNTRRFCASCRMEKCFAVGMDPLLILDEEERKALQARRREKQTRQEAHGKKTCQEVHEQIDTIKPSPPVSLDCSSTSLHDQTRDVKASFPAETVGHNSDGPSLVLAPSSAAPNGDKKTEPVSFEEIVEGVSTGSSSKEDSEVGQSSTYVTTTIYPSQMFESLLAQGRQFRHVEREELPWDMKLYWLLAEEERYLLTRLTTAYTNIQMTLQPPEPSDNVHPDQPLCLDSLMFTLETTLRKCVHFAKTVPHFMDLPEANQIAILKASALKTYALRSAALFVVERGAWRTYFGDLHLKDVKEVYEDHASVDVFVNYCAALKSVAKTNSTIYALLHCIVLFDVRNTRLEDFGKVSAIQDNYLVLLKHYLQSEFSYLYAGRYMAELMTLLEDMHNLHHRIVFFYKQFSSFFRPLISEFFAA